MWPCLATKCTLHKTEILEQTLSFIPSWLPRCKLLHLALFCFSHELNGCIHKTSNYEFGKPITICFELNSWLIWNKNNTNIRGGNIFYFKILAYFTILSWLKYNFLVTKLVRFQLLFIMFTAKPHFDYNSFLRSVNNFIYVLYRNFLRMQCSWNADMQTWTMKLCLSHSFNRRILCFEKCMTLNLEVC